jgi:hypothetical protein
MNRWLPFLIFLFSCVGIDVLDIELLDERIQISSYPTQLQVGDTFALEAIFFDSIGQPTQNGIVWSVSDNSVAEVTSEGLLIGISPGIVEVEAVRSSHQDVTTFVLVEISPDETVVNNSVRTGSLNGVGGYNISGEFLMYEDTVSNELILEILGAGIDPTAPGPYYYLSNQRNKVVGGVSFGAAPSGDSRYVLPDTLSLQSYSVLVVWCEPFGVTLGYGEFEN